MSIGRRPSALRPMLAAAIGLIGASAPVAADAIRLVALAPHLTELVFEIESQDLLVGVVEYSDYPPPARALPRIGDAFQIDLERLLAQRATHALIWRGGTPARAKARLESLGIETLSVPTRTLEEIAEALVTTAGWLGRADRGNRAAARFRERLATLGPATSGELIAFYQVSSQPLYTLGGRHVLNEVLARCGARNLFADLDLEATSVDIETVLVADPDVIIAGLDGRPDATDPFELWRRHTGLRATRCEAFEAFPADLLVRPTVRILDGAKMLCAWLDEIRRQDCRAEGG